MNEQRFVVSDVLWQRLEQHLPGEVSDAGATAKDNRLLLEAVLWRVRTGSPSGPVTPHFHLNNCFALISRFFPASHQYVFGTGRNREKAREFCFTAMLA